MDLDKVIMMLLEFDENEISNDIIEHIVDYGEEEISYDEDDIIDYALECIDNWSADQGLLGILVETIIEKLEEKNIKVR